MDLLFATKSVPNTIKTKMNHIHEACTQYLVTKILTCKCRNPSSKHKNRMQNKALASNQQSLVLLCIIELAPNVKDETPKSFLKNKPPNT